MDMISVHINPSNSREYSHHVTRGSVPSPSSPLLEGQRPQPAPPPLAGAPTDGVYAALPPLASGAALAQLACEDRGTSLMGSRKQASHRVLLTASRVPPCHAPTLHCKHSEAAARCPQQSPGPSGHASPTAWHHTISGSTGTTTGYRRLAAAISRNMPVPHHEAAWQRGLRRS